VIVACSTLCFGRHPFERALRAIAELGFSKVDVAVHEEGPHLRPSEVAADVHATAQRLRVGPGLTPCAFSVALDAAGAEEYRAQLRAVCRAARLTSVPLISVAAAPAGSGMDEEVRRLRELTGLAAKEGIILTVPTLTGTLTEDPDAAAALCEQVPGLGLTLDPSHYVAGPHQGKGWDQLYPHVRHVRLRDTGQGPNQFQVRIGQGEVEYGRIVTQLARHHYDRVLTVDIRDVPDAPFAMEPEVRKLKYLLESLV
jgi:sugar phosphate isomerase/epimerase